VNLGPWEILIIAVVIVLLFGARKMPAMARSLGQSMRILKAETKGMRQDEEQSSADSTGSGSSTESKPAATPLQLPQSQQAQSVQSAQSAQQVQSQKNAS
jgi:sec-independent protein translocase protein TatA